MVTINPRQEYIKNKILITESGCWEWTAYRMKKGYGQMMWAGKAWLAHRFSYVAFKGDIQEGLTIDHLCENKRCVNPDHLEPVTALENYRRADESQKFGAKKKLCKKGHPLSGDNLYIRPDGKRACIACKAIDARSYREKKKGSPLLIHNRDKTHCPRGHLYNQENTHVDTNGSRRCKTCQRERKNFIGQ